MCARTSTGTASGSRPRASGGRRHGSLNTTPQAFRQKRNPRRPGDLPRQDDATVHLIRVTSNGTAMLGNHNLSVGCRYAGTTVTLLRNGGHVTAYDPDGETIGYLALDEPSDTKEKSPQPHNTHPPAVTQLPRQTLTHQPRHDISSN